METMKSQLGLRSLDASGRPPGTGRSSKESSRSVEDAPAFEDRLAQATARDRETQPSRSHTRGRRADPQSTRDSEPRTAESRTAESRDRAPEAPEITDDMGNAEEPTLEHTSREHTAIKGDPSESSSANSASQPETLAGSPAVTDAEELASQAGPLPKPSGGALTSLFSGLGVQPSPPAPSTAPVDPSVLPQGAASAPIAAPLSEVGLAIEDSAADVDDPLLGIQGQDTGKKGDAPPAAALSPSGHGGTGEVSSKAGATAPTAEVFEAPSRQANIERAERILEQVRVQIRPEMREAVVELRPRELGRIEIQLSVRNGKVRASVRAERPEALSVLQNHLPELRAMFESAGLEAHTLELGLGFAPNGDRSGSGQGEDARRMNHATRMGAGGGNDLTTGPLAYALAERMGIDLFA